MTAKASARYVIRSRDGEELVCPSLADLHALYTQGFLADDDLVRLETSDRWTPAGRMPALRGVREQRADPRKVMIILAAAAILSMAVALLARGACGERAPRGGGHAPSPRPAATASERPRGAPSR